MKQQFTVIGDGGMGTVCALMLAENGHDVRIWSAFDEQAADMAEHRENRKFLPGKALPPSITPTADDAVAFAGSAMVVSAVPTQFTRQVWGRLKAHIPTDLPICSVTKGIENETLQRPTEILLDVLGKADWPVAALSGPAIAPEIADYLPASVAVASDCPKLAEAFQAAMSRPYFRIYTNPDMVGLELAGATKNVIAIAAGIIDGMKLGDNAKAALLTRGLAEITRLGLAAGAKRETFAGLAGVGDLVTTCISPVGRNRSFGEAIGKGMTVEQALATSHGVVEGLATTKSVLNYAKKLDVAMPLTETLYEVLFAGKASRQAIEELMTRPLRSET